METSDFKVAIDQLQRIAETETTAYVFRSRLVKLPPRIGF
jgi:hypothetical protein